ncbi:MAG TPA: efflux RND transporter periplasmic adaptor subunit [Anaeromyxobacteraceae bacterium]|nr:efflux RND transporter periplasmic adaptor subunit [Anaeromyxobacteraceae bacterium]
MTDGTPPSHDHHEPLPEGEEQAPPGTRTMAIVRWAIVALMALAAGGAWLYLARTSTSAGLAAGQQYLCPMHPQIVTDQKGECPICGMDLVPAGAEKKPAAAASAAGGPPAWAAGQYTCPMHPDFVTRDPAARCPECGMKLVARAPPAAPPAGVAGLAPVELTPDRIQLMGMRTATAARRPLSATIRAVGFVAANETGLVSVSTRYSGWVETLSVGQTGQLVRKGEVLATVYSPEMVSAQQVFLNAIKWSDKRGGAPAAGPQIANDLERDARQRLELAGLAGEDIDAVAQTGLPQRAVNLRSPVRGYVARKDVVKGLYVQPGTELFQIADLSTVWVLVDVYERELSRVRVGQRASFEVAAWPGRKFEGAVQFVYPALNTGSRTLQARLELRNPSLELRPGMYGDVTLDTGGGEAVVVPAEALVDTGEQQYVFVDRGGGRFEPRAVRAGATGGGQVAILEGLADGEKVVTTANFLLDSESRLRAAVEGFAAPAPAAPTVPASASRPAAAGQ